MSVKVVKIPESRKSLNHFIKFEFKLYHEDEDWVAPLLSDMKSTLKGKNNPLFANGPHAFFMAFEDKKPVGRILVGIDEVLNEQKGFQQGYFSLFECKENYEAAKALFDAGVAWLKKQGMNTVIGPLSPSNGDDRKGFVVEGDGQPVLLNAYTKKYYPDFAERYGFVKNDDHYAYLFNPREADIDRMQKLVDIAKRQYNFRIDRLDTKEVMRESLAIKEVLDQSIPDTWDYLVAPTLEGVMEEFNSLKQFYNGRLCYIARSGDRPVGFMLALPDFNQVLKKMKGKILPMGWLKYLYYKRKITGARGLVQCVVKEYQNRGVPHAMYFETYKDCIELGVDFIEASCIDETNYASRNCIERVGGERYRTYRTYRYNF